MKTYTDDALARALYRLAAGRMQTAGAEMPCSEDVFAVQTTAAPDSVPYAAIAAFGNADFLASAYLLLLGRPIDPPALRAWEPQLALSAEDFQARVLKTILRSAEYRQMPAPPALTDCPLPLDDAPEQKMPLTAQTMPKWLTAVYRKMPRPVQRLAKKLAGRE